MPSLYKPFSIRKLVVLCALLAVMMLLNIKASAQWGIDGPRYLAPGSLYTFTPTYNGSSDVPYCGSYYYIFWGGSFGIDGSNEIYADADCSSGQKTLRDLSVTNATLYDNNGQLVLFDENWNELAAINVSREGYALEGTQLVYPERKYRYFPVYNGSGDQPYCGSYLFFITGGYTRQLGKDYDDGYLDCASGTTTLKDAYVDVIWTAPTGSVDWYDDNGNFVASIGVNMQGYWFNGPTSITPGSTYTYTPTYQGSTNSSYCGQYRYEVEGGYVTNTGSSVYNGYTDCWPPNFYYLSDLAIDITWTANSGTLKLYSSSNNLLCTVHVNNDMAPPTSGSISVSNSSIYAGVEGPTISGTYPEGPQCYAYYWQKKTANSDWAYIPNEDERSLKPGILNENTYFRRGVYFCDGNQPTLYSNSVYLTVIPPPTVSISPASQYVTAGSNAAIFNATVTGGNGDYVIKWQSSPDQISWTGYLTNSLTFDPRNVYFERWPMYFRAVITSNNLDVVSNLAVINLCPAAPSSIIGSNICIKGSTLQLTNNTPGGSWKSSDDNIAKIDANGIVTGVAEGTVDITYSMSTNCASSAVKLTLTVVPFENVSAKLGKGIEDFPQTRVIPLVVDGSVIKNEYDYTNDKSSAHTIKNVLALQVNEEYGKVIPGDFTASVLLKVEYGHSADPASICEPEEISLSVNYTKEGGHKYDALNYFKFENAEFTRVTVVDVNAPTVVNGVAFNTSDVLKLTNTLLSTRYYQLADNKKLVLSVPASADGDALPVSWTVPDNTNNNGVQLEWAWLEQGMDDDYKNSNNVFDANLLFKAGATRIDLAEGAAGGSYNIPLLYDGTGTLYIRARAISVMPSGSRSDGPWSDVGTFAFEGHEANLNWQATTSYAEDGKRKSVVQYYDGSLRPRQTVTKDNTTGQTVVAETMYDMEGRPAVQILPAPGINNIIAYTRNLNRFNGQVNINENPADHFDFTTTSGYYATTPLDENYGAAKYYSEQNADRLTGIHQNIPKANGYPYSVTRYTPDGTGRIMRQSAPGNSHKMGSGHETLYFYGTPEQEELDALFGTEVGDKTHYFKNMVQDANGQMNVSYLDMQGRTIATALAGESKLEALPGSGLSPYEDLTRNLLSKETNLLKGSSIESVNTILVPYSTEYKFYYKLNKQTITLPTCDGTVTYDCKFDLQIAITDETGEHDPVGFNHAAIDNIELNEPILLNVGSYSVRKTLTINQAWLQELIAEYSADEVGVCSTLEQLVTSITNADEEASGCNQPPPGPLTSSECIATIGDFDTYKRNYATSINVADGSLTPGQINDIRAQYDEAIALCTSLDPAISSTLTNIRQQMLADMVPFTGQYADPEKSGTIYNKHNIFSPTGGAFSPQPYYKYPRKPSSIPSPLDNYYNDYGSADPSVSATALQGMSEEKFAELFQNSWANALLPYHPEFSKLKFAEDHLRGSFDFIDKLQANTIAYDPIPVDPFFNRPEQVDNKNSISNYTYPAEGGYGMWRLAYGSAVGCKTILNNSQRNTCFDKMPNQFTPTGSVVNNGIANVTLTGEIQSQAWTVYKALYTQVRSEMVNSYINESVGSNNETLIIEGYRLHFPKNLTEAARSNAANSNTNEWASLIPDAQGNFPNINYEQTAAQYGHPCDTYIKTWRQALLECPQLAERSDKDEILNSITSKMLEVCRKGTDGANPYGASTVAPAYSGDQYTSFEQVVLDVFDIYNIDPSEFCHPYGIEFPKQYGMNPPITKQNISTVEPCTCTQWNKILQEISQAEHPTGTLDAINEYLEATYQETITPQLYDGLLKCGQPYQICTITEPPACPDPKMCPPTWNCIELNSIPLLSAQPLPAFLVCGFDKNIPKCYSCNAFVDLQTSFNTIFGKTPVMTGAVPDNMVIWNDLFAKYVNYKTGLQHNWMYYASQFNGYSCPIGGISGEAGNSGLSICRENKPLNDATVHNPPSPCDAVRSGAKLKATIQYEYLKQHAMADFSAAYLEKCKAAGESFTVNYAPKEYHYTLYYYDQAGNLVKTVPPKGVQPNYTKNFLDGVVVEREKMKNGLPYTEKTPNHNLDTRYIYNSLNKVVMQKTPDAGISKFWYDQVGRQAANQNANQAAGNAYTYTKYDDLGRIVQTSQLTGAALLTNVISKDKGALDIWYNNAYNSQNQLIQTVYDQGYGIIEGYDFHQNNLRNRVAYTNVWNKVTDDYPASSTYYSYDLHGNVDELLQDFGNAKTANIMNQPGPANQTNRFKKIVYDYDLISGKVNRVNYQPGEYDAYYHRYEYDGENRLTDVYSGRDEIMLKLFPEREAHYDYYKHGPLASTTLGQLMVQKQDYAYTLQGWIKGVNPAFGGTLANGTNTAEAFPVAQDAYGFSLHYFDNDYNAIGYPAPGNSVLKSLGSNALSLYNGNIAVMAVNIPKLGANRVYNFHYDQLNRIVAMDAYNGLDISTGSFTPGDPLLEYKERISYDPNGNILSYLRNGDAARQSMDNLTYHYTPNTNQLHKVIDAAPDASADNYGKYNDIKQGQADDNYEYDLIGNLEKDHSENIEITWTVFGKIASINKSGAVTNYVYDAAGNRILKETPSGSTGYVRDGSGNVLSVYTKSTTGDLTQSEMHLYGSSRLGMVTQHETPDEHVELTCGFGNGIKRTFTRGEKLFELNNHLGNVLATVTDKRIASPASGNSALIDHYEADIASAQDYYPFGMMQPGRKFNAGNYRYGFNGKENDNDVKGEGNQQDYGMRVYDTRLGRFLSEDPITSEYPELTPYQFSGNNPIQFIDLDGLEPALPGLRDGELQKAIDYSSIKPPTLKPISESWFVWLADYSGLSGSWERTSVPTTVTFIKPSQTQSFSQSAQDYPKALTNIGMQYYGVEERLPNDNYNPVVQKFIHSVPKLEKVKDTDGTPWCSCFMNFTMEQTGRKGSENAVALSWRKWGVKIPGPVVGAVTSIAIGSKGLGHVNYVVGRIGNKMALLGGNQNDKVSVVARGVSDKYVFTIPADYYELMKDSIEQMTKKKSFLKSLPAWNGKYEDGTRTR